MDLLPATTGTEVALLLVAFFLSAIVGLERHRHLKSAGLRTHTLVGLGSATFTLVSSYGFSSVIGSDVVLDPSRISAQIVSGIGFLGAGLIFVRNRTVNGLTTAASIWVVAAIGMAAGAGMPVLAALTTALHLVAVTVLAAVARRIPTAGSGRTLVVTYEDGRGALRTILSQSTELGCAAALDSTNRLVGEGGPARIEAHMHFKHARVTVEELMSELQAVQGVCSVRTSTASLE